MSGRFLLDRLDGEPSAVLIDGDRIAAVGTDARAATGAAPMVCAGLRAVPGFIELQVNGVGTCDFTGDPGNIWRVGPDLARHGVTAFLPTIVSGPRGTVETAMRALADRPPASAGAGAVPLGLHVEGPFIASARRGAHDARHLRHPDAAELGAWVRGGAAIVTLAPELPGGLEAIERIVAEGGVASVGHTEADDGLTTRAIDAGARYATHLFNAMPPLHHRRPGAVGALLDDDRVTVGLIADGIHVDPRLLRLVARVAPGRVSLVSDAVAVRLGEATLVEDDGVARLANGTLAGSTSALDHGLRTFAEATGSPASALAAVTAVPAALLGLHDGRGTLRVGGRADVVLLDADLRVAATIVGGHPVYRGELSWA